MNGIRYHVIGNEIFLKGIKRVVCYGESEIPEVNKFEAESMAQDIAKHLNIWMEVLDEYEDENVKIRKEAKCE